MNHKTFFFVVGHAYQLAGSDNVLIAAIKILTTDSADEASDVVDGEPGSHDEIMGHETLATSAAFDTKPSFVITSTQ